jgi:hypothetical protein
MAFKRQIEIISGPVGGTQISVSEGYMSFDIEKTKSKTPNKANIKLYNLLDTTMTRMGWSKNKIIVKAGYEDEGGLSSIFFGDLVKSTISKDGKLRVLEIEAMDGYKNIQDKNVSLSYAGGTRVSVVLGDILNVLALPLGAEKPQTSEIYSGGFVFVGKAKDALSQVMSRLGYKWTIQNEQILIYQQGQGVVSTSLLLTPKTGLLKIDRVEQDTSVDLAAEGISSKSTEKKTPIAYNIETLLFHQIIPGAIVKIESSVVNGTFQVDSAKLTGDNFGGDFKIEAEVWAV